MGRTPPTSDSGLHCSYPRTRCTNALLIRGLYGSCDCTRPVQALLHARIHASLQQDAAQGPRPKGTDPHDGVRGHAEETEERVRHLPTASNEEDARGSLPPYRQDSRHPLRAVQHWPRALQGLRARLEASRPVPQKGPRLRRTLTPLRQAPCRPPHLGRGTSREHACCRSASPRWRWPSGRPRLRRGSG